MKILFLPGPRRLHYIPTPTLTLVVLRNASISPFQ
jgi:hypothetical protein